MCYHNKVICVIKIHTKKIMKIKININGSTKITMKLNYKGYKYYILLSKVKNILRLN